MNKLILLSEDQKDFLMYCIGYTMGSKNLVDMIIKETLDALSNPIDNELIEKIEYRKQRALDIPSNHSDSVAYGLDVAKEIIKSYGEEK